MNKIIGITKQLIMNLLEFFKFNFANFLYIFIKV